MRVEDVMVKEVVTIPVSATYEEAAKTLYDNHFSGAPVVDNEGNLVGMLSEKDLFKGLFPFYAEYHDNPHEYKNHEEREHAVEDVRKRKVKEFMSTQLTIIEPHAPILRAGAIMLAKGIFRLPVVKGEKLVGLVTRENIYRAIFKKYLHFS